MTERRRVPRHTIDGALATISASLEVRLLDISPAGALLESRHPVEEGARGHLRLMLGGTPFAADVEILRVETVDAGACYHVGAMFMALDPTVRGVIERFMTP